LRETSNNELHNFYSLAGIKWYVWPNSDIGSIYSGLSYWRKNNGKN